MLHTNDLEYSHSSFDYDIPSPRLDAALDFISSPLCVRRVIPSSSAPSAPPGRSLPKKWRPRAEGRPASVRYVRPTPRERQERLYAYYTAKGLLARGEAARQAEETAEPRATRTIRDEAIASFSRSFRRVEALPQEPKLSDPKQRALRDTEEKMLRHLGVLVKDFEQKYDRAACKSSTRTFSVSPLRSVAPTPDPLAAMAPGARPPLIQIPVPGSCEASGIVGSPLALPDIFVRTAGPSAIRPRADSTEELAEEAARREVAMDRHVELAIASLVAASRPTRRSAGPNKGDVSGLPDLTGVSETLLDKKAETTPADHVKLLVKFLVEERALKTCAVAAARLVTYVLMRSLPTELYEGDPHDYLSIRKKVSESKATSAEKAMTKTATTGMTATQERTHTTVSMPTTRVPKSRTATRGGVIASTMRTNCTMMSTAKSGTPPRDATSDGERYYLHQDSMNLIQALQSIALRKGFWLSSTVPMMQRPPMHACGLPLRAAREIALWQHPPGDGGIECTETKHDMNLLNNTQFDSEESLLDLSLSLPDNLDHAGIENADDDADKDVVQLTEAEAAAAAAAAARLTGLRSCPKLSPCDLTAKGKKNSPSKNHCADDNDGGFHSGSDDVVTDDYNVDDDNGGPNMRPRIIAPLLVISNGGYGVAPFSTRRTGDNEVSMLSVTGTGLNIEMNDTILSAMNNFMHPEPGLLPLHSIMHAIYRSVRENRLMQVEEIADDIPPAVLDLLMDVAHAYEDVFQSLLRKSVEAGSPDSFFTHTYRETLLSWSAVVVCESAIGYATERAGAGPANFLWTGDMEPEDLTDEQLEEIALSGLVERTFPQMTHWGYEEKLFYHTIDRLRSIIQESIGRVRGELYFLITGVDNRVAMLEQYRERLAERKARHTALKKHEEEIIQSRLLASESSRAHTPMPTPMRGGSTNMPNIRVPHGTFPGTDTGVSLLSAINVSQAKMSITASTITAVPTLGGGAATARSSELCRTYSSTLRILRGRHSPDAAHNNNNNTTTTSNSNSSGKGHSNDGGEDSGNAHFLCTYSGRSSSQNTSQFATTLARRRRADEITVGFRDAVSSADQCQEFSVSADLVSSLTSGGPRNVSAPRAGCESPLPILRRAGTSPAEMCRSIHPNHHEMSLSKNSSFVESISAMKVLSQNSSFRRTHTTSPRPVTPRGFLEHPVGTLPEDLTVRRVRRELVALKFRRRGGGGGGGSSSRRESPVLTSYISPPPSRLSSRGGRAPSAMGVSPMSQAASNRKGSAERSRRCGTPSAASAMPLIAPGIETAPATEAASGRSQRRAKEERILAGIVGLKQASSVVRLRDACENTAQFHLHWRDPTLDDGVDEGGAAETEWYATGKAGFREQRTLACIKRSRQVVAFDLRHISPITALAMSVDGRRMDGTRDLVKVKDLRLGERMVPWSL